MDSSKWRQIGSPKKHPNQLDWASLELPSQYEIFEQLTSGGMGSVFRAQNRYTGAYVAIKIIRSEATQNATAMKRFFLEAKAASSFRHPHICRVFDFGVSKSNVPYLVMDWVDGINLEKMMKDGYKPSVQEALLLFRQVAAALAHAHHKNIIHRDLKPENIMINYNAAGQVETQLIDFGIAKMLAGTEQLRQANANANSARSFVDTENSDPANNVTQVGVAVGTPAYMSPEQARGLIVDSRTDIYSLGCVMYFTLSGKRPFTGDTRQVMKKHLYELPDMPAILNVPEPLKAIIFKAMSKDLNMRYTSMEQLIEELDKLMEPQGSTSGGKIAVQSKPKTKRFAWLLWFVIGFSIVYGARLAWEYFSESADSDANKKSPAAQQDTINKP